MMSTQGIGCWTSIEFPMTICKTKIGRENQILASEIMPSGRYPVVDQGQAFIAGYTDAEEKAIRNDLPLVVFGDHTRCVKYVDFPFVLGADGTKVLKPKEDLFDPKFFYYALMNVKLPNRGYNRHFALLKERSLPRPEIDEQRKIAAVLGTVQRAIEEQERLLQLTTELKKSLLHQLFTEGLRSEPQKMTEVGLVPESWDIVRLGDVFDTQLGKMLSQKAHLGNDPMPYLRNKNVQWGRIDVADLLLMDFSEREQTKHRLCPGDLLVCEGGEPGRASLWNGELTECYYQKALHRLRPKSKGITNAFLLYWLMFSFEIQNLYGISGASSTIAHLPEVQLKALSIPCPGRSEQDKICEAIGQVDRKLSVTAAKHLSLSDLFRILLHQLMTAQIRVNELALSEIERSINKTNEKTSIHNAKGDCNGSAKQKTGRLVRQD